MTLNSNSAVNFATWITGFSDVGSQSGNSVTFRHPQGTSQASEVSASYRWSTDLVNFHNAVASAGGTTVTFTPSLGTPTAGTTTVTATVSGTVPAKLFVTLQATQSAP